MLTARRWLLARPSVVKVVDCKGKAGGARRVTGRKVRMAGSEAVAAARFGGRPALAQHDLNLKQLPDNLLGLVLLRRHRLGSVRKQATSAGEGLTIRRRPCNDG